MDCDCCNFITLLISSRHFINIKRFCVKYIVLVVLSVKSGPANSFLFYSNPVPTPDSCQVILGGQVYLLMWLLMMVLAAYFMWTSFKSMLPTPQITKGFYTYTLSKIDIYMHHLSTSVFCPNLQGHHKIEHLEVYHPDILPNTPFTKSSCILPFQYAPKSCLQASIKTSLALI